MKEVNKQYYMFPNEDISKMDFIQHLQFFLSAAVKPNFHHKFILEIDEANKHLSENSNQLIHAKMIVDLSSISAIHMEPQNFPDLQKVDFEGFTEENKPKINMHAYLLLELLLEIV